MIDLHAHSTASDGTLTPAALVRRAAGRLDVVAVTDHDTTAGWAEAAEALPAGTSLVRGAEISCTRAGISLHLLAYLFDPQHRPLAGALARLREGRVGRAERMVERLVAAGVAITWGEVAGLAGGTVGRPHIALGLKRAGAITTLDEAFTPDWIGDGGAFWVGKDDLDALEAIALVRDAGGLTVFAHPFAASRGRIVGPSVIEELAAAGLLGLEVDHPDHTDAARQELRALAAALELVVTGGSDFHGENKPTLLGSERTARDAYERLVAQATGAEVLTG